MSVRFGVELEVLDGARPVAARLTEDGWCGTDHLHSYHCRCDVCNYNRSNPTWTAQEDCSVNGEFITRILTWGDDEPSNAFAALQLALFAAGATAHDNDIGQAGNHVHVERSGSFVEDLLVGRIFRRLGPELQVLARSSASTMRGYNGGFSREQDNRGAESIWDPSYYDRCVRADESECWDDGYPNPLRVYSPSGHGHLLRHSDHDTTYEFRLWNSTCMAWRMHLHAGLSVAIVLAAKDGVGAKWKCRLPKKPQRVLPTLAPYMDDMTIELVKRELAFHGI